MNTHTKGEMRVDEGTLDCPCLMIGEYIIAPVPGGISPEEDRANAVRLAACWNLCYDVPLTDIYEMQVYNLFGDSHQLMLTKRKLDEARAALRTIADTTVRADGKFAELAIDRFRAIASSVLKEIDK